MRLTRPTRGRALLLGGLLVLMLLAGLLAMPSVRTALRLPGTTTATYTNPILHSDFPDPTVIRASDGWFYGYATQTITNGQDINLQVARSRDLSRWEYLGDALPTKPSWANETQDFWAPHVSEHDGVYYMYYSAEPNTGAGLCLAVATAPSPHGPFVDRGEPLQCGSGFANIDPMAFDDPKTGKRLLYWGSGFQAIRVQELAADRINFAPESQPVELLQPDSNRPYENLIEGAWVVERDGYYYLFYSGDSCCDNPHYAVMVARSQNATGPYEKLDATTGSVQSSVILQWSQEWQAPGHNSVFRDTAGQDWIVYHAIDPRNRYIEGTESPKPLRRVMLMDRIVYRDGWPQIEGHAPTGTEQQGPSIR